MLKLLHGALRVSLLHYQQFSSDIESIGCKLNPNYPHVTKNHVNGNNAQLVGTRMTSRIPMQIKRSMMNSHSGVMKNMSEMI